MIVNGDAPDTLCYPAHALTVPSPTTVLDELGAAVEFSAVGLVVHRPLDFDQWERLGAALDYLAGAVHWWLGDWVRYGEAAYGEMYAQAIEESPYSYGTLRNDVWVCNAIEPDRRRPRLTFGHHAIVAPLPPQEQDRWLDQAEENGWSCRDLRVALQGRAGPDGQPPADAGAPVTAAVDACSYCALPGPECPHHDNLAALDLAGCHVVVTDCAAARGWDDYDPQEDAT